jgi:hypothetical protein
LLREQLRRLGGRRTRKTSARRGVPRARPPSTGRCFPRPRTRAPVVGGWCVWPCCCSSAGADDAPVPDLDRALHRCARLTSFFHRSTKQKNSIGPATNQQKALSRSPSGRSPPRTCVASDRSSWRSGRRLAGARWCARVQTLIP